MNEISPPSPHNIFSFYQQRRSLNYERLDIQTNERMDLFSEESDASGSNRAALTLSRQESLSYERLVIQEDINQSLLQSNNDQDRLDLRASQQYSSYLLVERITLRIDEQFGFSANQTDQLSGLDTSVEGTSSSIFELSITIYQQYEAETLAVDESADPNEILADFMHQIRGAIDQGFGDTMRMLEQMDGFTEEIRSSVEETYNMLQVLLDQLKPNQPKHIGEEEDASNPQEDLLAVQEELLAAATSEIDQLDPAEIAESANDEIES
jgi:hypothetical protein